MGERALVTGVLISPMVGMVIFLVGVAFGYMCGKGRGGDLGDS